MVKQTNQMINLNGANYIFNYRFTIAELLVYLGFNTNIIVIDYNGTILVQSLWAQTYLQNNDSLEILSITGGG